MDSNRYIVIGQGRAWGLGETPEAAVEDAKAWLGQEAADDELFIEAIAEAHAEGGDGFFVAVATERLADAVRKRGGVVQMDVGRGWRPTADLADLTADDLDIMASPAAQQAAADRFIETAGGRAAAVEFEARVLSIGRELLPDVALAVLDGGDGACAYYDWLLSQMDD